MTTPSAYSRVHLDTHAILPRAVHIALGVVSHQFGNDRATPREVLSWIKLVEEEIAHEAARKAMS